MSGFIQGEARTQVTLLPDQLDEYVTEDNATRVIDVFIDGIDLSAMGFKTTPSATGRPAYHPETLLKLYVYGYLNRIQSSRRLEREASRNVELMWLLGRLAPDFKTIADFRKDHTKAIRSVCREFVVICRKLNLFTEALVAKDKTERLESKIEKLKKEIERLNEIEKQLQAAPDKQISLTDPDARSMISGGNGIVGYNVQTAVDAKNHLIVTHEVTNVGSDRAQLTKMATQAKDVLGVDALTAVADRGYYSGEEIKNCKEAEIDLYLPKPETSGNQAKGLFGKRDFIYQPEKDEYECPAGERAIYRYSREEGGKSIRRYWASACIRCEIKSQCTTGKYRRIGRWEHEAVLDDVEDHMNQAPEMMKTRRETVEHPFGTLKLWMGYTHFQMRTLERVSAEMSLHVLAYNLKRVMNIMGTATLTEALRA